MHTTSTIGPFLFALVFLAITLLTCSPKSSAKLYSFDCIDESKIRPNAPVTMEYNPVCGCDGRTYPNPGSATVAGVTRYEMGACPCVIKRADQRPCTMVYKPVCGCDGKTYSNTCAALNAGVTAWESGACE